MTLRVSGMTIAVEAAGTADRNEKRLSRYRQRLKERSGASVGEVVLPLAVTGALVPALLHAGTGRTNVVYRRRDGAIGWIDPPAHQN